MVPYLDGLLDSLDRRFQNISVIGAFHELGPKAAKEDKAVINEDLSTLSKRIPAAALKALCSLLQEWASYEQHLLKGAFKVKCWVQINAGAQQKDYGVTYSMTCYPTVCYYIPGYGPTDNFGETAIPK